MEKYRLLKDLPNAEAGEIFELKENGSLFFQGSDKSAGVFYKKEEVIVFDLLNPDKGWFEKIAEKKYGGRIPKIYEKYFFLDSGGDIASDVWGSCGIDKARFDVGNAFWTEEEAEKELKRRKAYVILKEDTKGFVPDWTDIKQQKYFVIYSYYDNKLNVDAVLKYKAIRRELYFSTKEDAKISIKNHKQEWLDCLGIEEEK